MNIWKEFSIKFNAMKSKWLTAVPRKRRWLSSQLDFCQFQVGDYHVDKSIVVCTSWSYN